MSGAGYSKGDFEEQSYLSAADRQKRMLDDLTSIDQKLVFYAGAKTPEEIAEMTGVPADQVAKRTIEVLNKVDYFTIQQKRAQQILLLNSMIAEVASRMTTLSDRNLGPTLNSAGGNIQRVLKALEDLEKRDAKAVEAQEQAYARRLLAIVQRAFDRMLGKLDERYPEIPVADLAEMFQHSILLMARELDAVDGVL